MTAVVVALIGVLGSVTTASLVFWQAWMTNRRDERRAEADRLAAKERLDSEVERERARLDSEARVAATQAAAAQREANRGLKLERYATFAEAYSETAQQQVRADHIWETESARGNYPVSDNLHDRLGRAYGHLVVVASPEVRNVALFAADEVSHFRLAWPSYAPCGRYLEQVGEVMAADIGAHSGDAG